MLSFTKGASLVGNPDIVGSDTRRLAHALGYQAQLGAPWFSISGALVYPPYAIFWWWFSYEAYAPRIFETGGMIAASGQARASLSASTPIYIFVTTALNMCSASHRPAAAKVLALSSRRC